MNLLDIVIVAAVVSAAVGGYRLGFVTRVLSWVGMLVGLLVAIRLLPWVLGRFTDLDPHVAAGIAIGLVFAGSIGGQAIGFAIGNRLRPLDEDAGVTPGDGVAGALAGVVGVLVVVWLLIPVLAGAGGWFASQLTTSAIARGLDQRLPDPPDTVQALRNLVGEGSFPEVFEVLRPTPDIGPPPTSADLSEQTVDATLPAVVKVETTACSRLQDGSGFVVAAGQVLTNAHVVAGADSVGVFTTDGRRLAARVVAFDPRADLALLSVPDLRAAPLPLGRPSTGAVGGVFGYPGGGPLRIAPAEVAGRLRAVGRDIYGRGGAEREVLELAAALRPGDSGAALVDPAGDVIGVVFAVATDRSDVAYALTVDEVEAFLARGSVPGGVSAGACVG